MGRSGLDFTEGPEIMKQPALRKHLIDDFTDFHGFITPGGKFSSQRLEDECSTALPSQCTAADSLESLPNTPAGFDTLSTPRGISEFSVRAVPAPSSVQSWQPGTSIWHPGNLCGSELQSLDPLSSQIQLGVNPELDALNNFLHGVMEPAGLSCGSPFILDSSSLQTSMPPVLEQPVSALDRSASEFKPTACKLPGVSSSVLSNLSLMSPPATPRRKQANDLACPLAPSEMSYPTLMRALQKNDVDMVSKTLEADPESARLPFWDHNVEPPLCTAIRLGCKLDIVDLLLKSGADVQARDFAGQSPLEVLSATTWHTVASSKEIEEVLLNAGAEPAENCANPSQNKELMSYMLCWNSIVNAGSLGCNLDEFGLPPSFGSIHSFDDLFEIGPPPL